MYCLRFIRDDEVVAPMKLHGERGAGGMKYRERITRDPKIAGGEPILKGTRVTLRTVLASLSDGDTVEDILRVFPALTAEDVRAAIAFAADSAREDLPAHRHPCRSDARQAQRERAGDLKEPRRMRGSGAT